MAIMPMCKLCGDRHGGMCKPMARPTEKAKPRQLTDVSSLAIDPPSKARPVRLDDGMTRQERWKANHADTWKAHRAAYMRSYRLKRASPCVNA